MKTFQFPDLRPEQSTGISAKISLRNKEEEDLFYQGGRVYRPVNSDRNPYRLDILVSWSYAESLLRELGTAMQRVMDARDADYANIIHFSADGRDFLLRIAHRQPPLLRSVEDLRQLMYPPVAAKFYRDKLCVVCELDVLSEGGRHHPDCPVAIFDGES